MDIQEKQTILNKMLFDAIDIFEANNIEYFLVWGTLLGSIRHHGMIPWDDDVDIGFCEDYEQDVLNLKDIFINKGYAFYLNAISGGIIIFSQTYSLYVEQLHLDVYMWKHQGDLLYDDFIDAQQTYLPSMSNPEQNVNKRYYINKSDLYPLTKHIYYDRYLSIPNNYEAILNYMYGNDCLEYGYIKSNPLQKITIKGTKYEKPADLDFHYIKNAPISITPSAFHKLIADAETHKLSQQHIDHLITLQNNGFEPRVIYDIGPRGGTWTIEAKKIWPNAKFILFDMCNDAEFLYKDYDYHIGVLGKTDDILVQFSKSKIDSFHYYYYSHGDRKDTYHDHAQMASKQYKLCKTLDSVVSNNSFSQPDLIKINASECARDILQGGINTISNCKYLIVNSYHQFNYITSNTNKILVFIEKLGFARIIPQIYNNINIFKNNKIITQANNSGSKTSHLNFFDNLCTSPVFPINTLVVFKSLEYPKIRIGSNNDGGYVILDKLNYDLMLSCGIGTDDNFEHQFLNKYRNIHCYAFDGTIDKIPHMHDRISFIKKNIGNIENNTLTNLHSIINNNQNIFLKMDIEGHEYHWLHSLSYDQLNKFNQIIIEFHSECIGIVGLGQFDQFKISALQKLAQTHYLVHLHGNNNAGINIYNNIVVPNVFECTYIKKTMLNKIVLNDEPIPSFLDNPNNPHFNDIFLSKFPYTSHTFGNYDPSDLQIFEQKIFSQHGEDGITLQLIQLIYANNDNKYYVEFGVEDGSECNTKILRELYKWNGLQMDSQHEDIHINLRKEFITKENIIHLFRKYDVPRRINLLSVDIDYNDFYVLNEILKQYVCDIIICEYNGSHPPNEDKIVIYNAKRSWDHTYYYGASLLSLNKLGQKYDYSLIYCENMGVNCYFLHNNIIKNRNLDFLNLGSIDKIYKPNRYAYLSDHKNRTYIPFTQAFHV